MVALKLCMLIAFLFALSDTAHSKQASKSQFPTPPRPIRLILSDIDGTLTTADRKFVEQNIEGFHLAKKLGIQVAFNTGRTPTASSHQFGEEMLEKTGHSGTPGVYMHGTYVVNAKGEPIADHWLSRELKVRLINAFKANGLSKIRGSTPGGVLNYAEETAEERWHKIYSIADVGLIREVRPLLEKQFRGEVDFIEGMRGYLEVMPLGINKGTGLRALAAELGVHPDEVLALGDTEADVPMFEAAGTGVAVANADEFTKQAADYVTVDSSEGALTAVVKEIERLGFYSGASHGPFIQK